MKKFFGFLFAVLMMASIMSPAYANFPDEDTWKLNSRGEIIVYKENGITYTVPKPKPIDGIKCDGSVDAMINIAESQAEYTGCIAMIGGKMRWLSYYANIWTVDEYNKTHDEPEPRISETSYMKWCSEFACWCARSCGLTADRFPSKTTSKGLAKFFSKQGRLYAFKATQKDGATNSKIAKEWFETYDSAGTMSLKDLKRGDILQLRMDGTDYLEPNHTAIVLCVENETVKVIEGNIQCDKWHSKVTDYRHYKPHEIIAVIRPAYTEW